MRRWILATVPCLALLIPSTAWAADYSEAVSGDISGDRLAPTSIAITQGVNTITATSMGGDIEYFTITIPAGRRLTAIRVTSYTGVDQRAFIAVQNGTTFTEPPTGTNVANLLGYSHFGPAQDPIGQNVLDNMATGAGSQGFSGVLGPGVYTFWAQQTGATATYSLAFDVGTIPAVPVPPALAVALGLALGFLGMRRISAAS